MDRHPDQLKDRLFAVLAENGFAKVYGHLPKAKPSGDGWMLACCPFHEDENPSFGFNTETGQWNCFSGCGQGDVWGYLMRERGLPFKEVLRQFGAEHGLDPVGDPGPVGQEYSYRDADSKLLYQVVRKPGKKWAQRRPNGNGGWVWNLKGVTPVLYHLSELAARPDETVFIVEGEKDADRLHELGLLATTNSGGAGKWKARYSGALKGRGVVIIPDNDRPGRDHAELVAKSLRGIAATVKVIALPDLPEKGDVSDWLDRGGTRETLLDLIATQDPEQAFKEEISRSVIQISGRQLQDLVAEAWDTILATNDPPRLFRTAGGVARVVTTGDTAHLELLDETIAYGLLIRTADWFTQRGGQDVAVKPPKEIAKDLLVNPHLDLPWLQGVINTPVFDKGWHILTASGYHQNGHLWLALPKDAGTIDIPTYPTEDQVGWARSLLLDHLLVDFPFASESDRAHAVAALLLPFTRAMFDGPTPIHLIEAPTPGSGKSLLAELISIITLGSALACTTLTNNEDEIRKKLTAVLSRGSPIIAVDNLQGGLWSAQVAAAVTAEFWEDRLLGKTQMVRFPNRALWLVSANNPKLSMEIARRCVRIRIDPGQEQPWKRTGFKHDPIREWARHHRWDLVRSILILVQHWIASGAPHAEKTLGSFEAWARVMGGMVRHLGLEGFLEDTDEFYEAADPESGEWAGFIATWWEAYQGVSVTAKDLLELAKHHDLVGFAFSARSESGERIRFGKQLAQLRDRRFGDHRVVVGNDANKKVQVFRLVPVEKGLFP